MSSSDGPVGCIMLAAGSGTRFGSDKRVARYADGATLLQRSCGRVPPDMPRILVLQRADHAIAAQFNNSWEIIFADDAHKGMGHSLAAAIGGAAQWRGAIIALGDMPRVAVDTFGAIARALTPARIVLPFFRDQRGNPVGIGCHYFGELASLQGDQGARKLLGKHAHAIVRLNLDDAGILQDVDTPAAL